MHKRTISITEEQDSWYHRNMIKLSEFVRRALNKAMEEDRQCKEQLKIDFPSLVKQME